MHYLNDMLLGLFYLNFAAIRIENEIEFRLLTIFLFSVRTTTGKTRKSGTLWKENDPKGKLSTTETQFHFQF